MEEKSDRFVDQNYRLQDFYKKVEVECPKCQKKAVAERRDEEKLAILSCSHCGHSEKASMEVAFGKTTGTVLISADEYFNCSLWYISEFKNEVFWALNLEHLKYLEDYIGAKLREHKDRTHFTLLEKLPKFYHEKKNREALLKLISKLKDKK